jgi:mannosyltransferase OCH1-like enzyme
MLHAGTGKAAGFQDTADQHRTSGRHSGLQDTADFKTRRTTGPADVKTRRTSGQPDSGPADFLKTPKTKPNEPTNIPHLFSLQPIAIASTAHKMQNAVNLKRKLQAVPWWGWFILAICVAAVITIPTAVVFTTRHRGPHKTPKLGQSAAIRIPGHLYSTGPFPEQKLPPALKAALATWKAHGPPGGLKVHWYDDTAAEAWVAKHAPQYLPEYQILTPGAYKADLWRLLVVYEHGGFYSDAGTVLRAPLWHVTAGAALVVARDNTLMRHVRGTIRQGVIGAVPKHPVIAAMIAGVIANIRARMYGNNRFAITGPDAVGQAMKAALHPTTVRKITDAAGDWHLGVHDFALRDTSISSAARTMTPMHMLRLAGKTLINAAGAELLDYKCPGYYTFMYTQRKQPRYRLLWEQRAVYKDCLADEGAKSAAVTTAACRIPAHVYMTGPFRENALPPNAAAAVASWRQFGPVHVAVHWYDDAAAEAWIAAHAPQYLQDYRDVIPGAFKADLWRLLILYEHGGVYADVGTVLQRPLWPAFGAADLVFCRDNMSPVGSGADVWQGVLAAAPRHPAIAAAIDTVVGNIRARYYGPTAVSATGPGAVGAAFRKALSASAGTLAQGLVNAAGEWQVGHNGDVVILHARNHGVHSPDGKLTFVTKPPRDYKAELYGQRRVPRYTALWQSRSMYR